MCFGLAFSFVPRGSQRNQHYEIYKPVDRIVRRKWSSHWLHSWIYLGVERYLLRICEYLLADLPAHGRALYHSLRGIRNYCGGRQTVSWSPVRKCIKANPSSPTREKAQRQRYQILREKLLPQDGSYLVHFHQDLLRWRHFLLRALRHHLRPMDNKDSWRRKLISWRCTRCLTLNIMKQTEESIRKTERWSSNYS